jgi:hypothetical protein
MSAYNEYEIQKANWVRKNPNATAQQYQEAIRLIAKRCGV